MYLVFDVGGTFTKYAIMTLEGEIMLKGKFPTKVKKGDDVPDFVESIGEIYDEYKQKVEIEGIAMDLPGQVDVDTGMVYGGGALVYLDNVNVGKLISERCDNLQVALENDAKAAAMAEVWKGNAKDVDDACVIVFGTGIGGAIIKNKEVHRGKNLCAGEFSFFLNNMTREQAEKITNIEEREQAKANGIVQDYSFIWGSQVSAMALCERVAKYKGLDYDDVDGIKIYEWAAQGDEGIQDILEDIYFNIARQCCCLQAAFDPEVILIGGGISAQPLFIEGIRRYANKMMNLTRIYQGLRIEPCKFLNDSNLYGALYHYKQKYGLLD